MTRKLLLSAFAAALLAGATTVASAQSPRTPATGEVAPPGAVSPGKTSEAPEKRPGRDTGAESGTTSTNTGTSGTGATLGSGIGGGSAVPDQDAKTESPRRATRDGRSRTGTR